MHRVLLPIIVAVSLITLGGCKGSDNDPISRNCAVERTPVEKFSVCLPDGWVVATQVFGEEKNFVVAVNDHTNAMVMQIHVKKDALLEPVNDRMEFAERAVEIARETAPNYKAISTEPVTVNGDETILHVFDASPDGSDEAVRYYQFVTIYGGTAYGFTAVMMPGADESLQQTLVHLLTNIRFS